METIEEFFKNRINISEHYHDTVERSFINTNFKIKHLYFYESKKI